MNLTVVSACDTAKAQQEADREEIARLTEEFLARGGEITVIETPNDLSIYKPAYDIWR